MVESILKEKSKAFALRIIRLYQFLEKECREYVMSKQILRSGTSIGANVSEAIFAQSTADFINKLSIAQKESNETIYWLELLNDGEYINQEQFDSMNSDAIELQKLLTSSIKTMKKNNNL